MARLHVKDRGWTAAALLAVLVGFVFFVLQNFGPESTVRRFHEALLRKDTRELRRVLIVRDAQAANAIVNVASRVLAVADGYRLTRRERRGAGVVLEIAYFRGNRVIGVLPWVVEKGQFSWVVNPSKTYQAMAGYIRA